ncbi:Cholesterol 7-alpha-monooxygenase, partial [Podochytrium sp. JEL0797]
MQSPTSISWAVCVALLALLAPKALVLIRSQYTQKANEPPLESGVIPYLGLALEYGKNPKSLLEKMRSKHGDCFTLFLAGKRISFVVDHTSFNGIWAQRNDLVFGPFANKFRKDMFVMSNATAEYNNAIAAVLHSKLKPHHLTSIVGSFRESLLRNLEEVVGVQECGAGQEGWVRGDLIEFVQHVFFKSSMASLLGKHVDSGGMVKDFFKYTSGLKMVSAGIPDWMIRECRNAQERLWRSLEHELPDHPEEGTLETLKNELPGAAEFILDELMVEARLSNGKEEVVRGHLGTLFGAIANTVPAACSLLYFVLSKVTVLEAVLKEIERLSDVEDVSPSNAPVLDACVSESLRLCSQTMSPRVAATDCCINIKSQKTDFKIRKDDFILLPVMFAHEDKSVYSGVNTESREETSMLAFNHSNFLNKGVEKSPAFYPFGGGVSMCPGRNLARRELIVFLKECLSHFEMKLVGESVKKKAFPYDATRFGFGALEPDGPIP